MDPILSIVCTYFGSAYLACTAKILMQAEKNLRRLHFLELFFWKNMQYCFLRDPLLIVFATQCKSTRADIIYSVPLKMEEKCFNS